MFYAILLGAVSRMKRAVQKTVIAPPAAIQREAARPCRSATAPARAGAAVPPIISPTKVARPIAVAANCGGTLSVGTSTKDNDETRKCQQPGMAEQIRYLVRQRHCCRDQSYKQQRRFASRIVRDPRQCPAPEERSDATGTEDQTCESS